MRLQPAFRRPPCAGQRLWPAREEGKEQERGM